MSLRLYTLYSGSSGNAAFLRVGELRLLIDAGRSYRALKEASPSFVSREALVRAVFDTDEDAGKLNLYIHYLRKKIETDGKKRIFACRGKGYSLSC